MIPSADTTRLSSLFFAKLLLNGCDCFICDFKQAGTAKLCRRDQCVEVQGPDMIIFLSGFCKIHINPLAPKSD